MNTYQEVLITCGYNDACVYAYLLNMADENGDFTTSIAQLSDITGLSPKQLRTILVRLERANVTANKRANGGTTITICKRDSYKRSRKPKGQTKGQTKRQIKESPLNGPLDVPPHTPLLNLPYNPPKESSIHHSACERFEAWLSEHCPYIRQHYKMMTEAELGKLKQQYGAELIAETCSDIENRIDLRKRYTNLYRTLLNWLKKRNENNRTTNPSTTREERLQQAAQLVYRLGEEANNPIRGLDQLFS